MIIRVLCYKYVNGKLTSFILRVLFCVAVKLLCKARTISRSFPFILRTTPNAGYITTIWLTLPSTWAAATRKQL